ncbi:MAG: hypothetical protein PHI97_09260 [Desulfobulbus sp.]|nr:hypothetical protein [Desulfobulbus sp.]
MTGYALLYSLLLLPNPSSCIGIGRWLEQLYVPFNNPALSVVLSPYSIKAMPCGCALCAQP